MRFASLCVLFIVFSSLTLAQSEKLPEILKPDAASDSEAQRMGANVFKLVPLGMFKDPSTSATDEANPIGFRGGGAFYSFSTGSHSYNKTPQIQLYDTSAKFSTGFAGMDYGFFVDLGARDLTAIDLNAVETQYFLTYQSPVLEKDIRTEYHSSHGRHIGGFRTYQFLPAVAGHTYLLRAFNFPEADTLVALQVLKIDNDGGTTIAWKRLADFPEPYFLYLPDEELTAKINAVIAEEKLTGIEFTVKDNWVVYIKGSNANINSLHNALNSRGIRYRGETRHAR